MRSASSSRKTMSSSNNKRKSNNGTIIRSFFLGLILLALGLLALAVHLTSKIGINSTQQQHELSASGFDAPAAPSSSVGNININAISRKEAVANNNANINIIIPKAPPLPPPGPYPLGPKTDAKYAKDRIYCMVPFVWNEEMYNVIMRTWGKRCNVVNFLTDAVVMAPGGTMQGDVVTTTEEEDGYYKHYTEFPEGTFPENVHFINMTRPWTGCKDGKTGKPKVCRHIWEKMWRSWIYVADNHLNNAEWFCKVDYDTYFFPENLQYYVRDYKNWDPFSEHHYFGGVLSHKRPRPDMAAGAAACWSHKTMKGIAEVYREMPKGYGGGDRGRCEDRPQASEEISTSMCLSKGLNVSVEPMRDDELREYVMVDPYHNHLTWNRTEQGEWWYWKGKPQNVGQMDDCCAIRPMAVHKYKRKELIEQLDQQFYGPNDNKELKRLNERTRRYADKVRRAMGIFDQ